MENSQIKDVAPRPPPDSGKNDQQTDQPKKNNSQPNNNQPLEKEKLWNFKEQNIVVG